MWHHLANADDQLEQQQLHLYQAVMQDFDPYLGVSLIDRVA